MPADSRPAARALRPLCRQSPVCEYGSHRPHPNWRHSERQRTPRSSAGCDRATRAASLAADMHDTESESSRNTGDLELEDTFVFSDQLRVVGGIGLREERGTSQTFMAGTVSNTSYRAFANVEFKPRQWLNLNLGGYFEHDQLTGLPSHPALAPISTFRKTRPFAPHGRKACAYQTSSNSESTGLTRPRI